LIFDSKLEQQKIEKIDRLIELGHNPYENATRNDTKVAEFLDFNKDIGETEEKRDESRKYVINGRIKFFRLMGKASFIKIQDESGMLQVYVSRDNLPEGYYNEVFKKLI
jgi:lysyl-tRNA synthetase class 2